MFYYNTDMIDALSAEKRLKPLMIEGMVIERPKLTELWRRQLAETFRQLADALERPATPNLPTLQST